MVGSRVGCSVVGSGDEIGGVVVGSIVDCCVVGRGCSLVGSWTRVDGVVVG